LLVLDKIKDPELEISILDHQLVREIDIQDGGKKVRIRLSFQQKMPGCPGCVPIAWLIQRRIVRDVKEAVSRIQGVEEVEIVLH